MATIAAKALDPSLWWEPFKDFFTELENAAVASCSTESLEKQLKDYHFWFLDTVTKFRKSNKGSREALDSVRIKIGAHELDVVPELKEDAIKISSILCLDEVQSYILVKRSLECRGSAVGERQPDFLNLIMLDYYTERQCLLKCTRQIFAHALYFGSQPKSGAFVLDEAHSLVNDGLEGKLVSVFEDLLSSNFPETMDVDLSIFWSEEILAEGKLILDILFLTYYESFSTCESKYWKRLCALYEGIACGSYHMQKLAVTPEAICAINHVKVQLLLLLIESLNLETLLQMIHDNVPFSQGSIGFSEADVLQMDVTVSSLNAFEANEIGPLILSWALFISLLSSLPGKEEIRPLMELDNIGYSRQAYEVSSLRYFLEILDGDVLKDSEGPVAGYRSVLRTFISAFIASYEINVKFGDDNLKLILKILSKIYRGEESLCVQFWDRDSFIDGPVRCLLCSLEAEFPFQTIEFISLLSALCEGAWPAKCVYNFLDKTVGLSTPFKMSDGFIVDDVTNVVESSLSVSIPGVESLVIPIRTRGQVLRMIDENCALVRWEYTESGMLVLLLRLAQVPYMQNVDELIIVLDLISRLVNFNLGVCYSILVAWNFFHEDAHAVEMQKNYIRVDVVEIICILLKSLPPSFSGTVLMSMGVKILARMLTCLPSRVAATVMESNVFDVSSSGFWLLSERLAKMFLTDCEESDCSLTLSVLDLTINLLDIGSQNDTVLALVVFSLQYVLINHEFWKYKVNHYRWKVTLKVFEVLKKCVSSSSHYQKLWQSVGDILFSDSSIHSVFLRIICITTPTLEKIFLSRVFDTLDIEGLHLSVSSGLDVLADMISSSSKVLPSFPVFLGTILSPLAKPVPVVAAALSLISYFRSPVIQLRGAKLLSVLFLADSVQDTIFSNANLVLNDMQVTSFRKSICRILSDQSPWNENLIVAVMKLLSAAASNQPAFLNLVFLSDGESNTESQDSNSERHPSKCEKPPSNSKEECILSVVLQYMAKSEELHHRKPKVLLYILYLLRELWRGAPKFLKILEVLKGSEDFWNLLTYSVVATSNAGHLSDKLNESEQQEIPHRYQILSCTLDILSYEVFLQKKLVHAKKISKLPTNGVGETEDSKITSDSSLHSLKGILSSWYNGSLLGNLIHACTSWEYDRSTRLHAKVASVLFAVHIVQKVRAGELGSLSVSLINTINSLALKLFKVPSFLDLLTQYSERGYSQGQELENLILNDLFYHVQGELEGREIDSKPFKKLMQFLMDSNFLDAYKYIQDDNILSSMKDVYLYDTFRLRTDMGFEMWDLLRWKESKDVGEAILLLLQRENSEILFSKSKVWALSGLIALMHMSETEVKNDDSLTTLKLPEQVVLSSIDHICQCLKKMADSLMPSFEVLRDVMDTLDAQAELLLLLLRNIRTRIAPSYITLVLRTSGHCLKVMRGCLPFISRRTTIENLLLLIITSAELTGIHLYSSDAAQIESVESLTEVSNANLAILPILCGYIDRPDYLTLSLAAVELILKGFPSPSAWFPILQRHLPLQFIIHKLQAISSPKVISAILKFLLNIAHIRQGAEMLLNAGILEYLRLLLSAFSDVEPFCLTDTDGSLSGTTDKISSPQPLWGLSLGILTAIIQSSADSSSSATMVDHVIAIILIDKAPLVSHYLRVPDFSFDGRDSKRARISKQSISLGDLKETHNTLVLICILARNWNSWRRVLQGMESRLREESIHLLAFISKAAHRPAESTIRDAPLLFHPMNKEEFELYEKPSFINSRNGWFALSALGFKLDSKSNSSSDSAAHTHLSDLISIEIYKMGFLLLKFLCIQTESAAKKAEELGFVDLAHFPELPMPDILHGLQDQGILIITDLCGASKNKEVAPDTEEICLLLSHITVMALYLELCVIQICGIRPVLGHLEVLSKELKLMFKATEGCMFLKEQLETLKQIVCLVHPESIHHDF